MRINVLLFGIFKDWLGASSYTDELPAGASVGDLLDKVREQIAVRVPGADAGSVLRGIAVSVNAEFASPVHLLSDGDEVGLLPPVSGGAPDGKESLAPCVVALVHEPIDAAGLVAAAKDASDGAVVVFDGIVRNNTRGRQTLWLDYEAYEAMALGQMREISAAAIERFGVRHVTLVHRLGRLQIGETSVLIVAASAHRAQAFEACRWLIDTLKKQVPIWKRETFADGAVWADGEPFPPGIALVAEGRREQ
jgi:molybdopterin synthase catalytic subunit